MHGILAKRMLAVQIFTLNRVQQARAVHGFGDRCARQFQQRRHNIPQLGQIGADRAVLADITLRPGDKQRHMDAALKRLLAFGTSGGHPASRRGRRQTE